jgi:hypothetical protein
VNLARDTRSGANSTLSAGAGSTGSVWIATEKIPGILKTTVLLILNTAMLAAKTTVTGSASELCLLRATLPVSCACRSPSPIPHAQLIARENCQRFSVEARSRSGAWNAARSHAPFAWQGVESQDSAESAVEGSEDRARRDLTSTTRASATVRIGAICNALERNGKNIKDSQRVASHRLLKMRCSPID